VKLVNGSGSAQIGGEQPPSAGAVESTSAQSSPSSATTNPRTRTAEWPPCSTT
jgi:hypothetical protein